MQTKRPSVQTLNRQKNWERRFAQLEDFKRRFGDCFVPFEWPENKPLGRWVATQRVYKRAGRLSRERLRRLKGIGFPWAGTTRSRPPHAIFWDARFKALLPIGRSSFWAGIQKGIYPQGIKLGPRTTVWRVQDIRAIVNQDFERGERP